MSSMLSMEASVYKVKVNPKNYANSIVIIETKKCMEDYNQNGEFCEKLLIEEFALNCTLGDLNTENRNCTVIIDEIRSVTCTSGYTDNGNGTCSGTQTTSAYYGCPSGYSGSDCSKTVTRSPSSSCPAGTRTISGSCYSTSTPSTCPSGYTFVSDFLLCDKRVDGVYIDSVSSSCASGLSQSGSYCYDSGSPVSQQLTCTSGYTLSGSVCEGTFYASKEYSCSSGYSLSGSTCYRIVTESSGLTGCSTDYIEINDSLCQRTVLEEAIVSCPDTYTYNESSDKCEKLDVTPLL